jgi:GTPase
MAKFKINQIFKITNRGSVVSGEIVEGEISSGDSIQFETGGKITELKIKSVEFLRVKRDLEEVALMVGLVDDDIIAILGKMVGETVSIATN